MKVLVSYRYSGEDVKKLEIMLDGVCKQLIGLGVDSYCVYFDKLRDSKMTKTPAEMMKLAFSKIDESDLLFVIQTSEAKSEGMLMEVGYAIAEGKGLIIAYQQDIKNSYLPSMTDKTIAFNNIEDLLFKIKHDFLTLAKSS